MYKQILKTLFQQIIPLIFTIVLVSGFLSISGAVALGIPLDHIGLNSERYHYKDIIMELLFTIGLFVSIFIFRKYGDNKSFKSLGFSIKDRHLDLMAGFFFALLIIGAGSLILLRSRHINLTYQTQSWELTFNAFMYYIVVAIAEEVLCRGYILNSLMAAGNKYLALIISSLIFALFHLDNDNMGWLPIINLFLAGILLGSAYIYTQNLWFPISLHLFYNFIQGPVLGYNVSGIHGVSLFKNIYNQQNIYNGGSFGFEGSIICTVLTSICILGVFIYFQKRNIHIKSAS